MGRTNPQFVDICPECNGSLTLIADNRYAEMYCSECGYSEDPRVQFKPKDNRRLKFKNQQEVPLL